MIWRDLWRILRESETLLDEARKEAIEMLDLAEDMFDVVIQVTVQEAPQICLDTLDDMDDILNEKQKSVRTKVFEHLAISKGRDVLAGLVLTSVVIDLERIGDYTKNMREVVSFIPDRLTLGEFEEMYESVAERTRFLFQKTRTAFDKGDPASAREHAKFYHGISQDVAATLKEIMAGRTGGDTVPIRTLGLAFSLRYMKRVAAHLKNICTAVSNPFPSIGFRPEE